ncbi:MAG TPA: tetratricopeptide repeat protein [Longimicrobiaceae bacterium]|nr:tetratricopeptide repeat protein [Longimicrobiaceae bacterium]
MNDWEAYYAHGSKLLRTRPSRAEAAFYWASRLNPERSEPLYAQWVAFWLRDYKRWERYLAKSPAVLESPQVRAADSLRWRALAHNPFVHQGLEILLYDRIPGSWKQDALTKGWIAYSATDFPRSIDLFGRVIRHHPSHFVRARYLRAQAFVALQHFDSAQAELHRMKEELQRREEVALVRYYESKELLEYATGVLHAIQNRDSDAREALSRALMEDLTFYPAHVVMGFIAHARSDFSAAAEHYRNALELAPEHGALNYRYGITLARLGRTPEAVDAFRKAARAEPFFADVRFELAQVLDAAGDRAGAVQAYSEYLRMAPRSATERIDVARTRKGVLGES